MILINFLKYFIAKFFLPIPYFTFKNEFQSRFKNIIYAVYEQSSNVYQIIFTKSRKSVGHLFLMILIIIGFLKGSSPVFIINRNCSGTELLFTGTVLS